MSCNYTELDAQRFIDHTMDLEEEILYAQHLKDCEQCREFVEEYTFISKIMIIDVQPPNVKEKVYRRVNRARNVAVLLVISMILSMALMGSHLILQYNTLEANQILQALSNTDNSTGQDSNNFAEVKVPEYMETSYSYGKW